MIIKVTAYNSVYMPLLRNSTYRQPLYEIPRQDRKKKIEWKRGIS